MLDGRTAGYRIDVFWLILCGILSSIWCLTAAGKLSATFDEPFYIEEGLQSWRTGSYDILMRKGTMPLPVDVETLPLYLWERYEGKPFEMHADFGKLLSVARAFNLLFWWLLLFFGWRVGYLYGGVWTARLGVLFLALEPNLLAHAALATTDISVTACLLAFLYYFETGRDGTRWRRIFLPGLWYGLAVLAKASALAFGVVIMAGVEIFHLWQAGVFHNGTSLRPNARKIWEALGPLRRDSWRIVLIGMAVVLGYVRSDWKPQGSFVRWAEAQPAGTLREVMVPLSKNLRIFSNAGEGIVFQLKHNVRGHTGVYILGNWAPRAVWYYFPTILLIKLTAPVLILLTLVGLLRPRSLATPLGVLTLLLLLFSLTCRVQIGIRLIMPLVVLLLLMLAAAIVRAIPSSWPKGRTRIAAGLLAVVMATPAGVSWPEGLTFINAFWGGSKNGYRLLSDSNCDWGQGLLELDKWCRRTHTHDLKIWYFGKDPRTSDRPDFIAPQSKEWNSPEEVEAYFRGSQVAVSTSIYSMHVDPESSIGKVLIALHRYEPVDRTQTFFIYDFRTKPDQARSP